MASRNYAAIYNALHLDGRLAQQCEMFLLTFAVPLINAEDPGTTNHAARLAWAASMASSPAALARAAWLVAIQAAQNATIQAALGAGGAAQDSDLEFVGSQFLPTLIAIGA